MSAATGGQPATSLPKGPTPVLDALEAAIGTHEDDMWDGAISTLLGRIAKVGIVSMTDRYSAFCNLFAEAYPDLGTPRYAGSTWIETPLSMTRGGRPHVPSGVLVRASGRTTNANTTRGSLIVSG